LLLFDPGDESLEDVSLPSGARALDLSFFSDAVPSTKNLWKWFWTGIIKWGPVFFGGANSAKCMEIFGHFSVKKCICWVGNNIMNPVLDDGLGTCSYLKDAVGCSET